MSRPRISGAARSSLRTWWPELITTALLVAIALAGQKDDPLFAVFCALIGAIFWAMGFRHRHLPLAIAIRDTHESMRRVEHKLDEAAAREQGPPRTMGKLIPFRRGG